LARLNHIPYCILPQTIGPFKNHEIKEAAFKSIVRATCCMARDKQSYDYVIKNVPALQNIKEYIDVAFFLPYKIIKQSPDYIHIGLNVSSLLWHGGYSQDNQFGLKCDYITVIRSIIEYFISFDNVKLHLISHVVSSERNVENDYAVCYDLWDYYRNNNLILAPLPLGPIDVKSYISGMDFFIGARMHATIGAFSSGVPVVPMAYSRKFNGLFLDTLSYPYMADMKIMSNDEVFNQVRFAFEHRYELKNCVRERMNSIVREKETLLIKDLQNFFFM
jgi:polysaccharide pyruvyl transferase WcaK-like protein